MSGIVLNETLFADNEEKIVEFLEKIQVNDKIRDKFKKFFEDPQNQMAICGVNIFMFLRKFKLVKKFQL